MNIELPGVAFKSRRHGAPSTYGLDGTDAPFEYKTDRESRCSTGWHSHVNTKKCSLLLDCRYIVEHPTTNYRYTRTRRQCTQPGVHITHSDY